MRRMYGRADERLIHYLQLPIERESMPVDNALPDCILHCLQGGKGASNPLSALQFILS